MIKGNHLSEEHKKKLSIAHKGKPLSEETKRKLSIARKGRRFSEEHKKKLSEANKGKHHISEEHKQRLITIHKGIPLSDETKRKISEVLKGENHPFYGKHHTEETKRKISEIRKIKYTGENHPSWKGGKVKIICKVCGKEKHVIQSVIKKGWGKFCSDRCKGIWQIKNHKQQDTDIECLIENELIRREIPYTKQIPLLGITIADFLLPRDIVVYADGSYWHSLKGRKEKDKNQDFMLGFYGYKVFRFIETDIKKSVENCINKVIKERRKEC